MNSYLTPYTEINSKWIKYLNVKVKTHIKKNIKEKLQDTGFGNDLLDMTSKARETKVKINQTT